MRFRPRRDDAARRGLTTAPESRCAPGREPLSITATGTSPSRSATAGASSSSCPSRIAQARPAGPAPTISTPTSIGSAGRSEPRSPRRGSNGGGYSEGCHELFRARTSSVSFGTTSFTSPTTPRSQNSKIGAFASLLMATIVAEACMPTLCWIAPEMPQAM